MTSLIQIAIEQFGNTDIDALLRTASIKSGLVSFSVYDEAGQEISVASKENESNLHNHEESNDVEINEAEEKTADFESGVNPDEILKHPGLS